MNSNSHRHLGEYLVQHFLRSAPDKCKLAFQIGCSEPDKNPITYLKGSLSGAWFRGHNWENTRSCVLKIAKRLDQKTSMSVFDYYCLGRLIHYTADAFTYAHNPHFKDNLKAHRAYEANLENQIISCLRKPLLLTGSTTENAENIILTNRISYLRTGSGVWSDSAFIKSVCSEMMLHYTFLHTIPKKAKIF